MTDKNALPDWNDVLSSICHLQSLIPAAVLVGGSAVALHTEHRHSRDHDHVLPALKSHFDDVLMQIEAASGWKTARIKRPVMILGALDGIETGLRQMIRTAPLETMLLHTAAGDIKLPTLGEALRIKGFLALTRNATRDYLDFVACADLLGPDAVSASLNRMDELYPQDNGRGFAVRTQLVKQLSDPRPYDLDEAGLREYKHVRPPYGEWSYIKERCQVVADQYVERLMDALASTPGMAAKQEAESLATFRKEVESGAHPDYPKFP